MRAVKLSLICLIASLCGLAISGFDQNVGFKIAAVGGLLAIAFMIVALYDEIDAYEKKR